MGSGHERGESEEKGKKGGGGGGGIVGVSKKENEQKHKLLKRTRWFFYAGEKTIAGTKNGSKKERKNE